MSEVHDIKIRRFFECLIPVTVCNLKCSYCYVIQRDYRNMKLADFKYSLDTIQAALVKERLGGICFFSICGAGETLAQPETLEIVHRLLENGHVVNITTNGTLKKKFEVLKNFSNEELSRIHFSFSYHYAELLRLDLLNSFFENVKLVHELGCSFVVQLNLCDEYMPYLEDIKRRCLENVGALPQIAATRDESSGLGKVKLMTTLSQDEYIRVGNSFNSELFKYTMENLNVKRNEFCYAGERSAQLNLATGLMSRCYNDPTPVDIFKNPNEAIRFEAMGKFCRSSYCFNSSHFMSLGVIDNGDSRTYCSLRDRQEADWFNPTMRQALSHRLAETNPPYSKEKIRELNVRRFFERNYYNAKGYSRIFAKTILKKIGIYEKIKRISSKNRNY